MSIHDVALASLVEDVCLLPGLGQIGGQWTSGSAAGTFQVLNPASGVPVATLPDMNAADAVAAIDAASAAGPGWAAMPARDRARILRRWAELMAANEERLAIILTAETGKPMAESRLEIRSAVAYAEWFAEEAKRVYGDTIPAPSTDRRMMAIKQPIGVVAAITPWNFPVVTVVRKVAPALAAGCAVVVKPAEQTPLSAIAIAVLAERSGVPAGVLNTVVGMDAAGIGRVLCDEPRVRKVSFTGSTEVGRLLLSQCANQVKKVTLELGGNAPFIVFDDADLDAAVEGAMMAKFRNAGQACVCANRIYVHSDLHDAFAERLVERVRRFKVGDGFASDVTVGPLIDERALCKAEAHIRDAVSKGATVLVGGKRLAGPGNFLAPTVLSGVRHDMLVAREETFAPVAPLLRFDRVEDVIASANDTEFGLAAYFYTRDLKKVWRVAEALEYGMVGINTGSMSSEAAPFGGIKQSGLGREGSRYGLDEYLEVKYLCMGDI